MFLYKVTVAVMYKDYTWAETSFTHTEDGWWEYPLDVFSTNFEDEDERRFNFDSEVTLHAIRTLNTKPIAFTKIRSYKVVDG